MKIPFLNNQNNAPKEPITSPSASESSLVPRVAPQLHDDDPVRIAMAKEAGTATIDPIKAERVGAVTIGGTVENASEDASQPQTQIPVTETTATTQIPVTTSATTQPETSTSTTIPSQK